MPNKNKLIGICLLLFLTFVNLSAFAEHDESVKDSHAEGVEHNEHEENNHGEHTEGFSAKDLIMHHILDAHKWHIMDIGETEVSVYLPVILWTENEGLVFFMSSQFEGHGHGPQEYENYILEGGKITARDKSMVLDFSITKNVLSLFFSIALIMWLFFSIAKAYRRRQGKAPKGMQSLIEPLIIFIRDDIAKASIGEKKYMKYLPFLLTVFFFIFINNLLGLVPIFPGGANLTGNIAVTMVLALFTFGITTFSGNKAYWIHIFNTPGVPWWLKAPIPLMPLVEFMGIFIKPFVLMVRLFANITAGHIIVLGFFSLIFIFGEMNIVGGYGISVVSIAFTIFMTILELLVAFIQAYVFTLLSALYFGMATEEHH